MGTGGGVDDDPGAAVAADSAVESLIPIVGRIVRARVADPAVAEDLVQETLANVLAKADGVAPAMLEPYAIAAARNVVKSMWIDRDRQRRNQHRVLQVDTTADVDEDMLRHADVEAVSGALARLTEEERAVLLAHEIAGQGTKSLGAEQGRSAGAVAAELNRTRARLRVEYLLLLHHADPPTERCRPVLLSLSAADRRRQSELGAARHLLECELCSRLSQPLLQRGQSRTDELRVPVECDADIVSARKAARELAGRIGFSATDITVIATAISEISRNIVRFADRGEVRLEVLDQPRPGLKVVARDAGPGIDDLERAMAVGYSTYHGLGLGLPGARRLMDEFEVISQPGRGTTVVMTKWRWREHR
ncbi:sigma-70 family RNA polymerase sigma factor [Microlunatus ginsengisoli]|uniref:Histidine kinase/HSP90-like ATPase domain-containing protein n=1 Tax=Microlunatus ginsengisoli TaxID=363863 RepID=A0ABP7AHS1_9ACTN